MNNDTKTGRHTEWFMTTVFTIIALVALLNHYEGDLSDQEKMVKWAVSGMCVALSFSALAVAGNLFMKEKFIGTMIEGGVAILTCGFWAAVLPTIMDPDNGLAVHAVTGGILNANMYFFSWGGFVMSFMALISYSKEMRGTTATPLSMSTVDILSMTSFVQMIAAVRLFQANECDTDYTIDFMEEMCNRTSFAVSLGAVSAIICFAWVLMTMFMSDKAWMVYVEAGTSVILLAMWCFGVGYITFGGEKAPAVALGNLYFFTWGSFALSVALFVKCFQNFMNRNNDTDNTPAQQSNPAVNVVDTEKQQDQGFDNVAMEDAA